MLHGRFGNIIWLLHLFGIKKVFITSYAGFKGTWLTLFLTSLGVEVIEYSSHPSSTPYLFEQSNAAKECHSVTGDITEYPPLLKTITHYQPETIFHLASHPLVTNSYKNPIETFKTNVLGTVHVLEAAKHTESVRVIINVTSDKCYENNRTGNRPFHEKDRLGGHDPYSASKACAELVATSYHKSFFNSNSIAIPRLASVGAGNVIGGRDWAENRLFPDIIRAYTHTNHLSIRNPGAIRPWQHVLDPLNGYVRLAKKLWKDTKYAAAWNFGPINQTRLTVNEVIQTVMKLWDQKLTILTPTTNIPYEPAILRLNSKKSVKDLE